MKKHNKKKIWRKAFVSLLAFLTLFVGTYAGAAEVYAAGSYMDKLNLTWGIADREEYTFQHRVAGIGNTNFTWSMAKLKLANAKRRGYKKLSYILTCKDSYEPTKSDVDKIIGSAEFKETGEVGFRWWQGVVDAETGKSLFPQNTEKYYNRDYDMRFKIKLMKDKRRTYYGSNENWVYFTKVYRVRVKIVYPTDYDAFCVGFSGAARVVPTEKDTAFLDMKKPFGKTHIYKDGSTNSRFVKSEELIENAQPVAEEDGEDAEDTDSDGLNVTSDDEPVTD